MTTISTHFKHLYIIGNGFDIHHSINSSYSNYRNWLEENEPDIYSQLCDLYGVPTEEDEAHEWLQKTVDIHPPKTGISVHFSCSLP